MTDEQKKFLQRLESLLNKHDKSLAVEIQRHFPEVFEEPKREGINVRIEWDKSNLDKGDYKMKNTYVVAVPTRAHYTEMVFANQYMTKDGDWTHDLEKANHFSSKMLAEQKLNEHIEDAIDKYFEIKKYYSK